MKQLSVQKKILLAIVAVLLVAACVFGVLLITAKSAVAGAWRRQENSDSDYYGTTITTTYTLSKDGTYIFFVKDVISGNTLKTEVGTWTIFGFAVRTVALDGSVTGFTYNPFTGILNNGGFRVRGSDVPFVRAK